MACVIEPSDTTTLGQTASVKLVLAPPADRHSLQGSAALKGLRPQLDIDTSHAQASARQIEDKSLEAQNTHHQRRLGSFESPSSFITSCVNQTPSI